MYGFNCLINFLKILEKIVVAILNTICVTYVVMTTVSFNMK